MTFKRISLLSLITIVVVGGGYLYMNFGNLLVRTTEKIATDAIGVSVDIRNIEISLANKKAIVRGISIGNPSGYKGAHAVTANRVEIGLNTASKDLIDFNDIQVEGSVVNVEINEKGMNLVDLKNLANRKDNKDKTGNETIRVIIKKMVIGTATVHTRVSLLDRDVASITMPAIKFSNIGSGGGIDAGDAITRVLTKYLNSVQTEVRKQGLLNGLDIPGFNDVEKTLNKAKDALKGFFQ